MKKRKTLLIAFRNAVTKHLRYYGLLNYNFYFTTRVLVNTKAQVAYSTGEDHYATFTIDSRQRLQDVDDLAHHEVLELLLADLATLAAETFNDDVVNKELHRVIYAIMNAKLMKETI